MKPLAGGLVLLTTLAIAGACQGPAHAAGRDATSFTDCDAQVRSRPGEYDSYDCYLRLTRAGRPRAEAVRRLEGYLALAPANNLARVVLARIEKDAGEARAEPLLRESAEGFAAARMPVGEVFARIDLAWFLLGRERLDEAETETERAMQVAEAAGVKSLVDTARSMQASIAYNRAEYARAYELFLELEEGLSDLTPAELRASVLSGLGGALWSLGRHRESLERYRQLADQRRAETNLFAEAGARYNMELLASFLVGEGGVSRVEHRRMLEEALDVAVRGANRSAEASLRISLAQEPDLPLGDKVHQVRIALALARAVGDLDNTWLAMRLLAWYRLLQDPGHPEPAFRIAREAIEGARGAGSPHHAARGLINLASMRMVAGPPDEAWADSQAAFEAIERIRDLQRGDLIKVRVMSAWAFFYYRVSGYLLSGAGGPGTEETFDRAFQVLERLRARILLDAMDAAGAIPSPGEGGPDPGGVREMLAPDEAMIVFQLSSTRSHDPILSAYEGSWVYTITRARVDVYPLPDEQDVDREVSLFTGMIERRDGSEREGAARLYRDLLGDALHDLPAEVHRLIMIPDKALYRLSFEALAAAPGDDPLGAGYEISIAPSAAIWLRLRQGAWDTPAIPALVLADPERPDASAPSLEREASPALGTNLGRLRYARREADVVVRSAGGESRALVGAQASEQSLKGADLSRYRIVHFAAHALLDEQHPERSALLLAPGESNEDGLLRISEIVRLDLKGRVVVLSACRTSAGAVLGGEGVMSLARAFFQAGARAVVGSLWRLRDDEAQELVAAFYRRLSDGATVDAALTASRRDLIRSGAPTAAWAGLIVLGDGEVVPLPGGRGSALAAWWPLATVAGFMTAALIFGVLLKRRRR